MPKVWIVSDEERISVSFNEYGQPIDKKTTSTLTHFMGSLARSRKYCPLHKPWPKVGSAKKKILLDVLNDKFDLPWAAMIGYRSPLERRLGTGGRE
ncbi:hypothetical protein CTI12_AA534620 [Artemisia annua]|uniref:Uncharacterized protein n=1 Tax=Artemisia annua TaxID=35608 RepID=A0A2U1L2M8_ARTAN|nr:hypothetical protein CTI12_AA534620 [Artemisia annua]